MKLNTYAAELKRELLAELTAGRKPSRGEVDELLLAEAKLRGAPQLGTTRYEPEAILIEFIYSAPGAGGIVVTVKVPAPERIVFLPVPDWVVESIWQGHIDGSYVFESEAQAAVASFQAELSPDENRKWFGPRLPKRRE